MNFTQISVFAKSLKKQKDGITKEKRKLVVKINNSVDNTILIVNPNLLQQTGVTTDNKIYVR